MSLSLYMDENVMGAITEQLQQRGVDVLTVQQDGRSGIDDIAVLNRAGELQRLLFTMDDDLLREAQSRQNSGTAFAGIAYARNQKITIAQAVDCLQLIAEAGTLEEYAGRVEYLPWR